MESSKEISKQRKIIWISLVLLLAILFSLVGFKFFIYIYNEKQDAESLGGAYEKQKHFFGHNIYYDGDKYKNIDAKTFEYLGEQIAKDKNNCYNAGEIVNISECEKFDKELTVNNKDKNKIICGRQSEFKNEYWSNDLKVLYRKMLREEWEVSDSENFHDMLYADVKNTACKIDNNLFFISIDEKGLGSCASIYKYDIEKNILIKTVVSEPNSCANKFGKATDEYIEYFGRTGDEEVTGIYHAKYYFNDDRILNLK